MLFFSVGDCKDYAVNMNMLHHGWNFMLVTAGGDGSSYYTPVYIYVHKPSYLSAEVRITSVFCFEFEHEIITVQRGGIC